MLPLTALVFILYVNIIIYSNMDLVLPYSIAAKVLEQTDLSTEVFDVDENDYVQIHINFSNKTCTIKPTDTVPSREDMTFASMLLNEA